MPETSWRVTVTVEVAVLLSRTEVGLATTDELAWETGPWKVTTAVWVMARFAWLVSVAV